MSTIPAHARDSLRQRYLKVDTATVSDVLDVMGYAGQGLAPGFTPFPADCGAMAGWAYTIRGQMSLYEGGGDPEKMSAVDGVSAGEITVWSGDGVGVCYFGELIALAMKSRGCAGALVDGGIRDIRWIGKQQFPVYACYRSPVQSIGRWKVTAWQVAVDLPGATAARVTVNPGDLVLADIDGAIIVPAEICERALLEAERLTATEISLRAELEQGATLENMLKKYGHV